jgi:hypothetical protein
MWAGGWTDIHDDSKGSFLHLFRESAQMCDNFKDMSRDSGVPKGGVGVFKLPPPPEIPKFWQSRTGLQIERKMFSFPIPTS